MSEIDNRIEELRRDVAENMSKREAVCLELGRFLLEEAGDDDNAPTGEYRASALEISSRVSLLDHQLEEIASLEESLKDGKESESDFKERKKKIQENLELLQETLGEELFNLLNAQDLDVPWKKAYDPLVKNISESRDNETALYQTESHDREQSFFKGLMRKSRVTVLKSKKRSMESSRAKLYRSCFKDALQMGAGTGDGKDAELLAPWFRTDKEWQSILDEEKDRDDSKSSVRERLKELAGPRGPKKRKEFLQREKEGEQQRLADTLKKWGEAVCGDTPDEWKDLEEVKKATGSIDVLTEEAIGLNLNIEKEEARKDIEKLNRDREYMIDKIALLEEEIQARRQEIRVLKKDLTASAKEIEKKKAFVGDPEDEAEDSSKD